MSVLTEPIETYLGHLRAALAPHGTPGTHTPCLSTTHARATYLLRMARRIHAISVSRIAKHAISALHIAKHPSSVPVSHRTSPEYRVGHA
eukprot:1128071-Rhodomonas_salina.1